MSNPKIAVTLLVILVASALMWAGAREPLRQMGFVVPGEAGVPLKGVAIMPKMPGPYPVALCFIDNGNDLIKAKRELRQIAELNIAAVSFESDRGGSAPSPTAMKNSLAFLKTQPWAKAEGMTCIGFGDGAEDMVKLLVNQTTPGMASFIWVQNRQSKKPASAKVDKLELTLEKAAPGNGSGISRAWLIGEETVWLTSDPVITRVGNLLRAQGIDVAESTFPREIDISYRGRPLVARLCGEYCVAHSGPISALSINVRPVLLWLWLPAIGALSVVLLPGFIRCTLAITRTANAAPIGATLVLVIVAVGAPTVFLVISRLPVNESNAAIAARWIVKREQRRDFMELCSEAKGTSLSIGSILSHVEIAALQRGFFKGVDDDVHRQFILSPWISGVGVGIDINWRRQLWINFFPRVRYEKNPIRAAELIGRFLRERMTIVVSGVGAPSGPVANWAKGTCSVEEFDQLYVAALRAVGIAARLDKRGKTEIYDKGQWLPAPRECVLRVKLKDGVDGVLELL